MWEEMECSPVTNQQPPKSKFCLTVTPFGSPLSPVRVTPGHITTEDVGFVRTANTQPQFSLRQAAIVDLFVLL